MPNREKMGIRVIDVLDWIINCAFHMIMLAILGISAFSLYDTYKIYNDAAPDNMYSRYRPLADGSLSLSFGELMEQNPDVIAWLTIDDTNIDYPVVQGENNSYYLNRDALGDYSLSGSIFVDSENASDFSNPYTLLYGHHMDYDVMFGGLDHFEDEDYFYSHRTGRLWISDDSYYEVTVVSCLATDAYDSRAFCVTPDEDENLLTVMHEYLKEKSLIYADDVDTDAHLLGLSTCTSAGTNARTLVFCTIGHLTDELEAQAEHELSQASVKKFKNIDGCN